LPSHLFTTSELAKFSGIDVALIEKVVHAFVLPASEKNESFRTIDDFNAVSAMPIIPAGEGRLLLLEQYTLQQSRYESPFFWMRDDLAYRENSVSQSGQVC
jgi:hypothetical protein